VIEREDEAHGSLQSLLSRLTLIMQTRSMESAVIASILRHAVPCVRTAVIEYGESNCRLSELMRS